MRDELRGARGRWRLAAPAPRELRDGVEGCSPMLVHLLYRRGFVTIETIEAFLTGAPVSHDPFLIPSMDEAVDRIAAAREREERVAVFGDFDCDGVTAAAILMETLTGLDLEPLVYIPSRSQGHGLNPEGLSMLAAEGVTLIITADCGIGAMEEVEIARSMGLDVIVTDHHEPRAGGMLPDCPVIAPTRYDSLYPFRSLCGAGVAYKVTQALARRLPAAHGPDSVLDLVALGTVADIVPLRDENRSLVLSGLERLRRTERPGLLALFRVAGVERDRINPVSISFYLAPRLNAANRMADPQVAYDLITTPDPARADAVAAQLDGWNRQRQDLVTASLQTLLDVLGSPEVMLEEVVQGRRAPILFVRGDWPSGISGLLASKLVDAYSLPVFVGAGAADEVVVSARSRGGIPIDELLERCEAARPEGLFLSYGGHARAGGFRVRTEDLETALALLETEAREHVAPDGLGALLDIDAEIRLSQVSVRAAQALRVLAPFGADFPEPLFLVRNVTIRRLSPRGDGRHASFLVADGASTAGGIAFHADPDFLALRPGDRIDLVFNLQLDEWQNTFRPELHVRDWRPAA